LSLLTPVLSTVNAFDATASNIFTFTVPSGGDQVTKNRLTIINQSSGATVYQSIQTTFAYVHTLVANTLTNGTYYSAYINTYNANGDMSANSNTLQFYCYTTPTFAFSNLPTGNVITNSSFAFQVTYNQTEGELLNSYEYFLYDAQNVQIADSGVLYISSTTAPPTVLLYTFSGFTDNTSYKIQATGVTSGGTSVSTNLVQISIQYTTPTIFTAIQLNQNCNGGYVTLTSNITDIEGASNPSPPTYLSNNEVDLTSTNSYVNWGDNQFNISGNWTLRVWGRNFTSNQTICTLQNANEDEIIINYFTDSTNMWWGVSVRPTGWAYGYYIESDHIALATSTQQVYLWLRRVNNIYQIQIANLG
jgi:hypothetical protein